MQFWIHWIWIDLYLTWNYINDILRMQSTKGKRFSRIFLLFKGFFAETSVELKCAHSILSWDITFQWKQFCNHTTAILYFLFLLTTEKKFMQKATNLKTVRFSWTFRMRKFQQCARKRKCIFFFCWYRVVARSIFSIFSTKKTAFFTYLFIFVDVKPINIVYLKYRIVFHVTMG